MIGEGERAGEISRPAGDAVDAGLQRIAAPAAEPLQVPRIGAAAGKRKAQDRVRRGVIIHARRKPKVCAVTLVEPTVALPLALLLPPYAAPQAVQCWSKSGCGGALVSTQA